MKKREQYLLILSVIAVPVIIYCYYLKWKTNAVSGDDLYIFKDHFSNIADREITNKFRPINSLLINSFFHFFQKNLDYFFYFNIGIQIINAYIFASVLNLFLKSPWLSVLAALTIGLSHFSFYAVTQLYNGGALEGLAMTFFLLSLLYLLKGILSADPAKPRTQKAFLISLLFANLSMYTHERYIVLFPFIIFIVVLFPLSKSLSTKQKATICALSVFSPLLNAALKTYIFAMPFFVGTGGTSISISFSSVQKFFADAVYSVLQINSGPEYLAGIDFPSLPGKERKLIYLLLITLFTVLVLFIAKSRKAFVLKQEEEKRKFYIFLSLFILLLLCLAPAVVTIRLEQRWLVAPFGIFILMAVVAISSFHLNNSIVEQVAFVVFIGCLLWINFDYNNKGAANLFFRKAEITAELFKAGVADSSIRANTSQLYILQRKIDTNTTNEVKWAIANGYIFKYYQGRSKKIIFSDSVRQFSNYRFEPAFSGFNKDSSQIIYIGSRVTDVTGQFLKDSLKNFSY